MVLTMADVQSKGHHGIPKKKKKKNIRVFVQRKRLSAKFFPKRTSSPTKSIEKLTSIIEKNLNRNKKNKNIVVVNYKPVFVHSRHQKPVSTAVKSSPTPPPTPNHRRCSTTTPAFDYSKPNSSFQRKSVSLDVPDVEDPLMFIEMMYQQLFTEDGQPRSGIDPTSVANRVKQIVTQSRRNSIARRDSLTPNMYQPKHSSLSSSPRFLPHTFSEDEEPHTLSQRSRTSNASRRSSKRVSIDHGDHHQQQLHAFLNSLRHQQKRTSTNHPILNVNSPFSIDDTDNEDLDTFSDLNSYRKTIRYSPPTSIDEDTNPNDSKLLSSSGYQSFKSAPSIIPQKLAENGHQCCPNCTQSPQIIILPPPPASSISLIQPIREMVVKYLNFIFISKNILLVPLFIFLLRQRSIPIGD